MAAEKRATSKLSRGRSGGVVRPGDREIEDPVGAGRTDRAATKGRALRSPSGQTGRIQDMSSVVHRFQISKLSCGPPPAFTCRDGGDAPGHVLSCRGDSRYRYTVGSNNRNMECLPTPSNCQRLDFRLRSTAA